MNIHGEKSKISLGPPLCKILIFCTGPYVDCAYAVMSRHYNGVDIPSCFVLLHVTCIDLLICHRQHNTLYTHVQTDRLHNSVTYIKNRSIYMLRTLIRTESPHSRTWLVVPLNSSAISSRLARSLLSKSIIFMTGVAFCF